jgi:hypothetical protein
MTAKAKREPQFKFPTLSAARAYVYGVCASMLEHQYASSPENREGWMFGGVEDAEDRRRLLLEIKRLEAEMYRRAARARNG